MSTDDKKIQDSALAVLDYYQQRTGDLQDVLAPTWNARADTLKTIVSLSSASIVLSVTFSSSLRQLNAGSAWRYLIACSFGLFAVSLITAFFALWWGARLYHLKSRMVDKRLQMNNVLMTAKSVKEAQSAFEKITGEVLKPIYDTDNMIATVYGISGLCFCIAVLLLAIVGIARLV